MILISELKKFNSTRWIIEPSFKYDLLCLINILTGDPFYLRHYQRVYEDFLPKLTLEVKKSIENLRRIVQDEYKSIISANLCLIFSATSDENIPEMIRTIHHPEDMKKKMQQTPYYDEDTWPMFESIKDDLEYILQFLQSINIYRYWKNSILPKIKEKIDDIVKELPKYDVILEDEKVLGEKLSSNEITVYILHFVRPHGIKITGTRFLNCDIWPFAMVVRTATHEMLHPPYDFETDQELRETLETLKDDEFLMDKVLNHNPSFGYNTFKGFIEEDCVQALDQIASEKLNIGKDPQKRWKENDDGMHVFAIALYMSMKEEKYNRTGEKFRDFLVRIIKSGKLKAGKIKDMYNEFYQ